jgi:hypothetical protein
MKEADLCGHGHVQEVPGIAEAAEAAGRSGLVVRTDEVEGGVVHGNPLLAIT